jgi:hypothetical protein
MREKAKELMPIQIRSVLTSALGATILLSASVAPAQAQGDVDLPPGYQQQQTQPPPGYGPPPAYYPPPPAYGPGYSPGPGYGYGVPQAPALGPKRMDYEEGDPIPAGYHVKTSIRKGWVIGGFATFGGLWLISAITAGTADSIYGGTSALAPLYIPAVGPFITIGTVNSRGVGTVLLVLDGVGQTGMLALAIAGLAAQKTELVRNDIGWNKRWTVAPILTADTAGLGIMGSM